MRFLTLITLILVFFFLARQIRLLVTLATGNFLAGALVADIVIAGLVLFYITYALGIRAINELKLDRVKLFLLAILAVAFLQSLYFANEFSGQGESVFFRAFSSFRKVFLPLSLLFVFSYLIKNEIAKNGDMIFKRLSTLFTIFLWVAIAYNFLEFALRTVLPKFGPFYLNHYLAHTANRSASNPYPVAEFYNSVVQEVTGMGINRVYGIGLDVHLSGAIIFLCYLFYVFLSGKFRVLSILNCLVFLALVLSGTRQFIFPFLVLNTVIFARRYGRKNFLAPILTGIILAGGVIFFFKLLIATLATGSGYFYYFGVVANPIRENLELFIFGKGPITMTIYGRQGFIQELSGNPGLVELDNFGFLAIMLEVGLIMSALFVLFHVIVFRINTNINGRRQLPDQYTKRLKIIILLGMVVTLAHFPLLFDRTIIVFHVLVVALLYSWSRYKAIPKSHSEPSGEKAGERKGTPPQMLQPGKASA